jgi:hypothetical protein
MVWMNFCREFFWKFVDGLDGFSPRKCLDEFLWKSFGKFFWKVFWIVWTNNCGRFLGVCG